ncbi:MAG TPA: LytTR family DNA-binding domain-containing protein [Bacteroidia bacterium]|jgi:two-component system LytT family response regulator|nr:LytTR family DNA-binding domain-containing protein [Bacteroidia bacterium]
MDCIIVDDSKMARTTIKLLISQVSFLNLKKECSNPVEAFNYLETENIDLIFLDVEMPEMTGIEMLKNLKKRPIVILVTSKKDYAVEAFELNVADYIIKPVTMPRFMAAVDRAKELYDNRHEKIENTEKDKDYIFVRSNSVLAKIKLDDITYIQALGDYVNIFTLTKRNMVHCTLKSMEEKLPGSKFFRLHRSYLIAIDHIDKIEENAAYIGQHAIPIGEQFRKELLKRLNLI